MPEEEINEYMAEVLKRLLQSTMDYLVTHDRKEIDVGSKGFKDEVDEDFINGVHKLEELIDEFLEDEFLDGKPIIPMIDELRGQFEGSLITKSKQQCKRYFKYLGTTSARRNAFT